jgi:hypothetical protein
MFREAFTLKLQKKNFIPSIHLKEGIKSDAGNKGRTGADKLQN